MNILFLTIVKIDDISERGIYTDLMRHFNANGHQVYITCPIERRFSQPTNIKSHDGINILSVKTLNIQKTNLIEKGIGTLLVENQFLTAIKKYFNHIKFDLVLYATPPITFTNVIRYIKNKDKAKSYLLLKDIFPQNAVDLKMISENGILHKYFKKKEAKLYAISDYIGCMSPANVDYILEHHKLDPRKVEVNPNSLAPLDKINSTEKFIVRNRFNVPIEAVVFIYGGNLGKPQGIDFVIEALEANLHNEKMFFVIVGNGTEFANLNNWFVRTKPKNVLILQGLPKVDYDNLLSACDVGLIFLDKKFTIPNFPSRLLSYQENKMPVVAATDTATDLGSIMENNDFGVWAPFGNIQAFNKALNLFLDAETRNRMGKNSHNFMMKNYLVSHSYHKIIDKFDNV